MKDLKLYLIFSIMVNITVHVYGKVNDVITIPPNGEKVLINKNWITRQAAYIMVDGAVLSSGKQDFRTWLPATVPGTVLTSLLHNGLIPSPYYGLNNLLIPDIFRTGNDFYTYWFVNQFNLPEVGKDKRLWLNFRGINYKAEIFLNGKRISTTTHEGMFIRRSYDITAAAVTGVNTLAVLVMPPDFPGEDNGGQAGDGQIGKNNTMQCTPGWDWIQAVRDRNTGIWDEVSLMSTGNIRLTHPQVISKVPGIRTPGGKQADATLMVNAELENLLSSPQTVSVSYEVEKQQFSTKVQLAPREKRLVSLPSMTVKNPRLWWPNCMGDQELYDMTLTVTDGVSTNISDKQTVRFGIREIATEKDPATGGRKFFVNGQKVFIRGGNYIASDWMLQLSAERYRTEVRFLADMNLNMLRIWGGALPERPEFYNVCDEFGLLVFQDLSVTGDANGAWNDRTKKDSQARRWEYPDNHVLFIESVIDQIKMLRNHPSLCIWCGGNEWPPAPDIVEALQNDVMPKYDNRHFAVFSTDTVFTRNTIGGVGDGPYGIQEPEWFFTFRSTPFNPELGSIGVPEASALRAFMDEADYNDFPRGDSRRVNRVWEYHRYLPYGEHIGRYFQPKNTEEFCSIAQLLNFEQYRALMEGWASNMWNWYTGMLIWKIQNPWTALRGQMYDCFLDVNACYYGTRAGGEPLHVQYNYATHKVEVVNTTVSAKGKCTVRARIYGIDGKIIHEQEQKDVVLAANSSKALFAIAQPSQVQGAYFLRLELSDGTKRLSDNVYWLTTQPKDYSTLKQMAPSQANVSIKLEKRNTDYNAVVHLKAGDKISFFNRVSVFNKNTGERILPVFYSDNYFTVFPNEEKTIILSFATNLPQEDIVVEVREWNGKSIQLSPLSCGEGMGERSFITLSNTAIEVGIAPELGGRIVFLRKPGTEGMLLSDSKIWNDPSFVVPEITQTPAFYPFNGII